MACRRIKQNGGGGRKTKCAVLFNLSRPVLRDTLQGFRHTNFQSFQFLFISVRKQRIPRIRHPLGTVRCFLRNVKTCFTFVIFYVLRRMTVATNRGLRGLYTTITCNRATVVTFVIFGFLKFRMCTKNHLHCETALYVT